MNAKSKALCYADRIKDVLIEMDKKGELPIDINKLNVKKIQKVLLPVFQVLADLATDAQMAIDGDWDVNYGNGESGFKEQIIVINNL